MMHRPLRDLSVGIWIGVGIRRIESSFGRNSVGEVREVAGSRESAGMGKAVLIEGLWISGWSHAEGKLAVRQVVLIVHGGLTRAGVQKVSVCIYGWTSPSRCQPSLVGRIFELTVHHHSNGVLPQFASKCHLLGTLQDGKGELGRKNRCNRLAVCLGVSGRDKQTATHGTDVTNGGRMTNASIQMVSGR